MNALYTKASREVLLLLLISWLNMKSSLWTSDSCWPVARVLCAVGRRAFWDWYGGVGGQSRGHRRRGGFLERRRSAGLQTWDNERTKAVALLCSTEERSPRVEDEWMMTDVHFKQKRRNSVVIRVTVYRWRCGGAAAILDWKLRKVARRCEASGRNASSVLL